MIKLYSKPGCGGCIATERDFNKYKIDYNKVDISEDVEAYEEVLDLGYSGVPVVFVADNKHWVGYRPDSIKELV